MRRYLWIFRGSLTRDKLINYLASRLEEIGKSHILKEYQENQDY